MCTYGNSSFLCGVRETRCCFLNFCHSMQKEQKKDRLWKRRSWGVVS
ncbi:hypothetical protein RUMCAL_01803 [Ruminococcus callidus ATCC 27760]|uniref:Uncharacterized protein n=1 Tax=Ruminococcus callidus ATCC 27760 TaxID=411473 RepID=U2KS62_9FIRM|nr:hypothetical protein RUMCAL_01803 [Ruminococcus callidus ATCC 27760]